MKPIRCPGIIAVLIVSLLPIFSLPAPSQEGRGFSIEGRRAAEEARRRDERKDEGRIGRDTGKEDRRVTNVNEAAREGLDLTKRYNAEKIDLDALEKKIEADRQRKADERRRPEEGRREESRATAIESVGRGTDLTRAQNAEVQEFDALAAKIETKKAEDTLKRIEAGQSDPHRNDGAVFENREGRLPKRESGYYHEYVYREPESSTPGEERVVVGRDGDVYFTSDHYQSFRKIK